MQQHTHNRNMRSPHKHLAVLGSKSSGHCQQATREPHSSSSIPRSTRQDRRCHSLKGLLLRPAVLLFQATDNRCNHPAGGGPLR